MSVEKMLVNIHHLNNPLLKVVNNDDEDVVAMQWLDEGIYHLC